ncbi:MAG: sterol desaturase family protein [Pseudomonadota bacterium]
METVDAFVAFFFASFWVKVVLAPILFCAIGYFVFGIKSEASRHAIQNGAATIVFAVGNLVFFILVGNVAIYYLRILYYSMSLPSMDVTVWTTMPAWLASIIVLIVVDFIDYWSHRLFHTRWFWPVHAAHHSDTHVNAFTSHRFHFLETMLDNVFYIVLLSWMNRPDVLPIVVLVNYLHGFYVHMDLPFKHGPFKLLIASPVFHRWHHMDTPEAYGKNLAATMPVWDVIFGTYKDISHIDAPMGARASGVEDKNPIVMLIEPFLIWGKLFGEERDRRENQVEG